MLERSQFRLQNVIITTHAHTHHTIGTAFLPLVETDYSVTQESDYSVTVTVVGIVI